MRGNGYTLSRLPIVLALLAGALILSGVPAPAVADEMGSGKGNGSEIPYAARDREAAFAMPRLHFAPGDDGRPRTVELPLPLSPSEAASVRRTLGWLATGNLAAAQAGIEALDNRLLVGTLLAQRYLGRFHRATPAELAAWLARYGDHPDAAAIHALLAKRVRGGKLPDGTVLPRAPSAVVMDIPYRPAEGPEDPDPPEVAPTRTAGLEAAVAERVQRGNVQGALALIARTRGLDPMQAGQLRGDVVHALLIRNEDEIALRVALSLRGGARADAPALYYGGLAAWRLDRWRQAGALFEVAADGFSHPAGSPRLRAAAAYWAARASQRLNDAAAAEHWLKRAAADDRALHGLLARRALAAGAGLLPGRALLSHADIEVVGDTDPGWRAFALLQVDQKAQAALELGLLWPRAEADRLFARSLMLVARAAGLTEFAMRLAAAIRVADGHPDETPRFAVPKLQPQGGFSVDPALVYAVAHAESNFDPGAISPAGARGLMQITPSTARYLHGTQPLSETRLHEPGFNLALGQRYLDYLSRIEGIGDDLLRILASYNAGPGGYLRWAGEMRHNDDPLLFLELIPIGETRAFVSRVVTYAWLYAARLHLPASSLDALVNGEFPRLWAPPTQIHTLAVTGRTIGLVAARPAPSRPGLPRPAPPAKSAANHPAPGAQSAGPHIVTHQSATSRFTENARGRKLVLLTPPEED